MNATVVVGVDGTGSSRDALVWAARAAVDRDATLEIVHAIGHPTSGYEIVFDEGITQHAKQLLEGEADRAEVAAPGVRVRLELDRRSPGIALTRRSADAGLLVVGAHRLSIFERAFVGSRSYQVVAGAHCPVAVVPHLPAPGARRVVVVGTDGSSDGQAAVMLAAAEADLAGAELHVVHVWEEPVVYTGLEYLAGAFTEQAAEAERVVLDQCVTRVTDGYPELRVTGRLARGRPAEVLVEAAKDALLLVVGSRGRHGVARMLLGSVSHAVVLHAPCPVLVART